MLLIIKINTHHSPEKNNIGKGFSIKMNDRVPSIFVKQLPSVLPTPPFYGKNLNLPFLEFLKNFFPLYEGGSNHFQLFVFIARILELFIQKAKFQKI